MILVRSPDGPVYQFKVRDLSDEGAGVVVRPDSGFLGMIAIGRELTVGLVLPVNCIGPSGNFRARIAHITEIQEGPFNGHLLIGLSFHHRITLDRVLYRESA